MIILLAFHICAGAIGILSGAAAMSLRKGTRAHTIAGRIFVVSMLSMSLSGALVASIRWAWTRQAYQVVNLLVGLMTFYLVATGWLTGWRRDSATRPVDRYLLVLGAGVSAAWLGSGFANILRIPVVSNGLPAPLFFLFGSIALLGVIYDARVLTRGRIAGVARLTRHLWRMCVPMLIAVNSLFLGQMKHFPAGVRKVSILGLPGLATLIYLIFWLVRQGIRARRRNQPVLKEMPVVA